MLESALDLDESLTFGDLSATAHANAMVREARKHGARAKATKIGVLATMPDGSIIVTRSAARLVAWLGY